MQTKQPERLLLGTADNMSVSEQWHSACGHIHGAVHGLNPAICQFVLSCANLVGTVEMECDKSWIPQLQLATFHEAAGRSRSGLRFVRLLIEHPMLPAVVSILRNTLLLLAALLAAGFHLAVAVPGSSKSSYTRDSCQLQKGDKLSQPAFT